MLPEDQNGKNSIYGTTNSRCCQTEYSNGCFSLEMSAEQITGRVITNYTGIPNSSILRKGLKYDEIEKFAYLKKELLSLKIYIDDTPYLNPEFKD